MRASQGPSAARFLVVIGGESMDTPKLDKINDSYRRRTASVALGRYVYGDPDQESRATGDLIVADNLTNGYLADGSPAESLQLAEQAREFFLARGDEGIAPRSTAWADYLVGFALIRLRPDNDSLDDAVQRLDASVTRFAIARDWGWVSRASLNLAIGLVLQAEEGSRGGTTSPWGSDAVLARIVIAFTHAAEASVKATDPVSAPPAMGEIEEFWRWFLHLKLPDGCRSRALAIKAGIDHWRLSRAGETVRLA